jgi:hypothetical protein
MEYFRNGYIKEGIKEKADWLRLNIYFQEVLKMASCSRILK